ncbi:MAG TPA: ADP-ribosylglycohydrolase family protein [Streptosporangiaceae bacterium]
MIGQGTDGRTDRARGAMLGLAIGDALGMPTQMMSRERIRQLLGSLTGFVSAPIENEISSGTAAGRVTDDTDQAVIMGNLLVEGHGRVDQQELARRLLAWQENMTQVGSADLLGPSTRRALEAVRNGVPTGQSGRWGDTNGAAMRITPVGIAVPFDPLDRLADVVADVGRVTHNTSVANAGATAVAAAVSAGIDGGDTEMAALTGIAAAFLGARRGHYVAGADVAVRIAWARDLVRDAADDPLDTVYSLVGTGVATQEAVPAAFALAQLHSADPWQACLAAASLGGDSDTVAAMTGAMLGACHGMSAFPDEAIETLMAANPGLGLVELADQLLALRDQVAERGIPVAAGT